MSEQNRPEGLCPHGIWITEAVCEKCQLEELTEQTKGTIEQLFKELERGADSIRNQENDEPQTERDMLKGQVLDLDQVIKNLKTEKRELESEFVLSNTILSAVDETLEGKEPGDFMLSFGIVRQVFDIQTQLKAEQESVNELSLHSQELEAENKALRKMLLAGSPPYYEKWQKLRKKAQKLTDSIEPACTCSKGYTDRGLQDPSCEYCDLQPALDDLKQALEGDYGI